MSVEFSTHAVAQLKRRGIAKNSVVSIIREPENKVKSFKNRSLRQKRFGGKMLEVVTVTEGSKITVVTAYYLDKNEN
jgi:hypothetical protein